MAKTPAFKYAPMFQLGKDDTEYRLLTKEGVSVSEFEGKEIVKDFTIAEIEAIYNGIGPDRFPEWLRDIITMANGLFQPAALIHDLRFDIGGTKEDFTAANDEFRENCYALVNAAYAWYDPRRYKWLFRAWRYAGYCEEFGWEWYHKK